MSLKKAEQALARAQHLFHVYGFVGESKLLLNIANMCFLSMSETVTAFLEKEHAVPLSSFSQQLLFYKLTIQPKHHLDPSFGTTVQELYILQKKHKEAPIEIAKKDSVIMYSELYEKEELDVQKAKTLLEKAKLFIDEYTRIYSDG